MPHSYSAQNPPTSLPEAAHRAIRWIARIPAPTMDKLMVEIGEPPLEELFAALAVEQPSVAPPADVPVKEPEGERFDFIELNRVEEKAPAGV